MGNSRKTEEAIFKAVADAADGLDLELEASGELDERMVGIFAAPVAHSGTAPADGYGSGSDSADNDEIKQAIYGWANCHPEDVISTYGQFTTDPYVAVMPGGVKTVDKEFLEAWLKSDDLKKLLATWSPKRERNATLDNFQIVYLSDTIANATFQGRELGENDVPVIANGAAILVKLPNGKGTDWKIASVSKFGDFE